MIETANEMKNDSLPPKALLLFDPWFYPIHERVSAGVVKLHCPVLMLHSVSYHRKNPMEHFDSWGQVKLALSSSSEQKWHF